MPTATASMDLLPRYQSMVLERCHMISCSDPMIRWLSRCSQVDALPITDTRKHIIETGRASKDSTYRLGCSCCLVSLFSLYPLVWYFFPFYIHQFINSTWPSIQYTRQHEKRSIRWRRLLYRFTGCSFKHYASRQLHRAILALRPTPSRRSSLFRILTIWIRRSNHWFWHGGCRDRVSFMWANKREWTFHLDVGSSTSLFRSNWPQWRKF